METLPSTLNVWAIVPVKVLSEAKSRLASVLSAEARSRLVLGMLRHTLDVLTQIPVLGGVIVISADSKVGEIARSRDAIYHDESDLPGLNTSLTRAAQDAQARGAQAVLILPGDLPNLRRESVVDLLLAVDPAPRVVVVPDRHGQGTNALLMAPPDVIPFHFGPDSFCCHCISARDLGVPVVIRSYPDIATDVDLPEDLHLAASFL